MEPRELTDEELKKEFESAVADESAAAVVEDFPEETKEEEKK